MTSAAKQSDEVTVLRQACERCCARGMYNMDITCEMSAQLKVVEEWDRSGGSVNDNSNNNFKHKLEDVRGNLAKLVNYIDEGAFAKGGFKFIEAASVVGAINAIVKRLDDAQKASVPVIDADSLVGGNAVVTKK